MTMNWKRNSKKYIAGILTIALAVGAGQSYGSMEVSAQERTLPGIEKLVQDTGDMRRAYMQFRRRIWPLLIKRVFRQKIMWTGQSIRR